MHCGHTNTLLETQGVKPLWTDRMVISGGAFEFDRLDRLVPLESGWDGSSVFAIRITMVKHLQVQLEILFFPHFFRGGITKLSHKGMRTPFTF
jgi:hypothetical protein